MAGARGSSVSNRLLSHSAELVLPECLFHCFCTSLQIKMSATRCLKRMLFFFLIRTDWADILRHCWGSVFLSLSGGGCFSQRNCLVPGFVLLSFKRHQGMTLQSKGRGVFSITCSQIPQGRHDKEFLSVESILPVCRVGLGIVHVVFKSIFALLNVGKLHFWQI